GTGAGKIKAASWMAANVGRSVRPTGVSISPPLLFGNAHKKLLTILKRSSKKVSMNKLSNPERAKILGMMVEGMAIRAISRLTGASKNTIAKLLVDAGNACSEYQDKTFRNLPCKRVQVHEIWS